MVKLGELNELAYEDLILSINGNTNTGRVAFNLVKNCNLIDQLFKNFLFVGYYKSQNYDLDNEMGQILL